MLKANDLLPRRGLPFLLPLDCCSSPGAGWVESLSVRLFIRDDLLLVRSRLGEWRTGDDCKPALIVAAAWSDESEGERGDGGLGREASAAVMEIRRGRAVWGEAEVDMDGAFDVGSVFRSGIVLSAEEYLREVATKIIAQKKSKT